MNIIDKLMKIDAGTLETPKAIHKMYVKKIGEELEFEIQAINAEKATEIQQKAIKIENGNVSDIDVYKTKVCPLAKVMRYELKKRGVKKLKVVYSEEMPMTPDKGRAVPSGKRQTPGSISFVPPVAGMIIGGEVIKDLIGINK